MICNRLLPLKTAARIPAISIALLLLCQFAAAAGLPVAVPYPVFNYFQSTGIVTAGNADWLNQNAQMTPYHPDPVNNPNLVVYTGGGFGPNGPGLGSFSFNTTLLQNAPPGVQQWWAANQPGANGQTYGSPAYLQLYAYLTASAYVATAQSFLADWGNIANMSGSDILAKLRSNPLEFTGVMNQMTTQGIDPTTPSGADYMINYMKSQVIATQFDYNKYSKIAADFIQSQQAANQAPDWGAYDGHWFDEINGDTSASAAQTAQMVAELNAIVTQMTTDLAALPGGTDPTAALSSPTTVATLLPIYQNYSVTAGQGGSSVIQMGTTQIIVPSGQITMPTNQIPVPSMQLPNAPTAVMTSLELQPSLCGR